jgi:ABC-type phosphate transport system substrate-binding protein
LSVLVLAALVVPAGKSPAAADPSFLVIIHPEVEGTKIPREVLTSIFLKEALRWGDGLVVSPVDQSMQSEVRASFSQVVLGKTLEGIRSLWHQKVLHGVMPPPVKSSDEDVIAYVAKTRGAIGYVSSGTVLPATVKPVRIID